MPRARRRSIGVIARITVRTAAGLTTRKKRSASIITGPRAVGSAPTSLRFPARIAAVRPANVRAVNRTEDVAVAKLTAKTRNALPDSDFAGPDHTYPDEDKGHARAALARASEFAPPGERARIRRNVKKKFPNMEVEGDKAKHRRDRASRRK